MWRLLPVLLVAGCATKEPDYAVKMWVGEDTIRMEVTAIGKQTDINYEIYGLERQDTDDNEANKGHQEQD